MGWKQRKKGKKLPIKRVRLFVDETLDDFPYTTAILPLFTARERISF